MMQAIARANRVAEGKSNGLIIDYIGIVQVLKKALASYTRSIGDVGPDVDPTYDKEELINRIIAVVAEIKQFLAELGCDLVKLRAAHGFDKEEIIEDAEDALCKSLEVKKNFQVRVNEVKRLLNFVERNELPADTRADWVDIREIAKRLATRIKHVDNTDLMVEINRIISNYVSVEKPTEGALQLDRQFDISRIDFNLLRAEFAREKRKNLVLRDLEELVQKKVNVLMANNPTRANYYQRYNEIIEEYNNDQDKVEIEKVFIDLINLTDDLTKEQQRYVRENLDNEEQLALYDMLYSDSLSKDEIKEVKALAKELYSTIHGLMEKYDHWAEKQQTRESVKGSIYNVLYDNAPDAIYEKHAFYQNMIFEYYYTRYGYVA